MRRGFDHCPLDEPFELNTDSPQAAGIVADWPVFASRGMNKLRDLGGRGLDGTFNGGLTWGADAQMGAALTFDGSTGYVSRAAGGGLPIYSITNPYSIAFWVKGPPGTATKYILAEDSPVSSTRYLLFGSLSGGAAEHLLVTIRPNSGGAVLYANSATHVLDNLWHHVAWTDVAGAGKLYVNGKLDAASCAYTPAATTLTQLAFGAKLGAVVGSYWPGTLAGVRYASVVWPPPVIWQMANPPTMWDLYRPVMRFWPGFVGGAVSISPDLASLGGATGVSIGGVA
jgi:hypothetical protein